MPQEFDVVCLGGGVAGEAIAVGLQDSGLTLAVVERELVGGECPYWGCVPSKTLLRSGETLTEADRARVLAAELGPAFARLGCRVDIIEAGPTFLGHEEPEAGAALRPHLEADGIMLTIGDPCVAVEQPMMGPSHERSGVVVHLKSGGTVRADRLLVATGRRPNVEAWRGAGLAQTERGWLKVDPTTLEVQPGVFGAGDVTGLGGFTHLAYYHGQIVARRLRGMDARADHTAVPRVTFTDPEVASVGLSEAAARAKGIDVVVASADPAETARGYIHDFHRGALKLVADRARGVLVGATLVTPRAGEIVGELVLAIKLGTPLQTLADVIHPFPAFNRMLGESLNQLVAKAAKGEHHEQYAGQH